MLGPANHEPERKLPGVPETRREKGNKDKWIETKRGGGSLCRTRRCYCVLWWWAVYPGPLSNCAPSKRSPVSAAAVGNHPKQCGSVARTHVGGTMDGAWVDLLLISGVGAGRVPPFDADTNRLSVSISRLRPLRGPQTAFSAYRGLAKI